MKERPILMSGPMVRAILEGRKTQTRRIVKQVTHWEHCGKDIMEWGLSDCYTEEDGTHWLDIQTDVDDNSHKEIFCPYGQPGDRLWVRETWAQTDTRFETVPVAYRATDDGRALLDDKWRPSIHMPRWASRITLEITGVRVERLQDISRGDAIAEGVDWKRCPTYQSIESFTEQRLAQKLGMACFPVLTIDYIGGYKRLWESINGPGSWDKNPWVWVVEFKKLGSLPAHSGNCEPDF